jgi:hypothetical protein
MPMAVPIIAAVGAQAGFMAAMGWTVGTLTAMQTIAVSLVGAGAAMATPNFMRPEAPRCHS